MEHTIQESFWSGNFGEAYTDRNTFSQEEWDKLYLETWGITKIAMNEKAMGEIPRDAKILEVGCNIGMQLSGFKRMGFKNLYGIELQAYAVEKAKATTQGINIIQGSGFDIPFRDNYFDLVCTNGVLIHIDPVNLKGIMSEIYRCSSRYIMGFEYYNEQTESVTYRGHTNYLWKADYEQIYRDYFPSLRILKKDFYTYSSPANAGNKDCLFLLGKG
jgi:pseudaminic acid biosynthesis-associated methylase